MERSGYTLDTGLEAFGQLPEMNEHLASVVVRSLSHSPLRRHVVDLSNGRNELRSGMILAVALAMGQRWKETIPDKRVGVVFPAGLGGILTNLALVLVDKVPVNLNFSVGRSSVEQAMAIANVSTVISAGPIKQKFPDFPWPEHTVDLVRERVRLDKKEILKRFISVCLLPGGSLVRRNGVPLQGGDKECGLLFSSGSTGTPKGIALTHRNIIGNCRQIHDCELLARDEVLLACLPTFHSFGFTATLWYPLIYGVRCVTLPSPLDTRKITEAIEKEKATVMMGTPTFLRPYFKRAKPEQLSSLKYVVGGAEKTPPGFAERWEKTFGSTYLEGYGLTETSPVTSVNLPATDLHPARCKTGSVGKLMKGMRARVVDPSSGEVLPQNQQGILEVQGINVFKGYLNNPEATQAAIPDGWFRTGDLARIDEENYIFIEGRLSRFSKLGGEMVPHGRVEQAVAECFNLDDAEEPQVAVTGISDESKGEALVLLATVTIDSKDLRTRLLEAGLPNLWIPKIIFQVEAIPSLASGKLDLKALNSLAGDRVKASG